MIIKKHLIFGLIIGLGFGSTAFAGDLYGQHDDMYMNSGVDSTGEYVEWTGDEDRKLMKYEGSRAIFEIGKRMVHAYLKSNHGNDYAKKHNLPDVRGRYDLGGWSTKLRVSGTKAMVKWNYEF